MIKEICIIGAGKAGSTLAKELSAHSKELQIKLIDKNGFFFDKKNLYYLLFKNDKEKITNLEEFSKTYQVEFIKKEVERINFNKRTIYFKDKGSLPFPNLVVSCGLTSKPLSIKGVFREGFFYLSDMNLFLVRDYLKISSDIIVYSSTVLGLKLAFYLSFLGKDIKLLTENTDYLGEDKENILFLLKKRNIDIYENTKISEVIGEAAVKATKTSLGKVFSSQLVFVDSGFIPNCKLLDPISLENNFFPKVDSSLEGFHTPYPGIYLLGDIRNNEIDNESFFLFNSQNVEEEAKALASHILNKGDKVFNRKKYTSEQVKKFLEESFKEENVLSLLQKN